MNAFQTRLFDFIEQYHPEMMDDKVALKQFLEDRADAASIAFEIATKGGFAHNDAMEISNLTLYNGLDFAPIELLSQIAEQNNSEAEEVELIELYLKVKFIFDKYPLTNKDFAVSDECELLEFELVEYIKKNGLLKETTLVR